MVNTFLIPPHKYSLREHSVIRVLEDFKNLKISSFLNVGFRDWDDIRSQWWIRICEENNIDWKILEIYKTNVDESIFKGCPQNKIILGDILDLNKYDNVDCLMFWHGPEHIKKDIFLHILPDIEKKVNKLIIFGMPRGFEFQDVRFGNMNELHLSEWFSDDWKKIGYDVIEINDREPAHITAYKKLSK